jgi:hypothetical protein
MSRRPHRLSPGRVRSAGSAGLEVLQGEGRPFGAGGSGGSLRRPDRPDCTPDTATPLPRYCHANATPLLARAAVPAAAAFLQVDPPPGAESPAKTAGDSAPYGGVDGRACGARSLRSQDFRHASGVPWPGATIGCGGGGGRR